MTPASHLGVLRGNLNILPALRFDNPESRPVVGPLDDDEIGIVHTDGTARLEILNVESREVFSEFGKTLNVASLVKEVSECRFKLVVASDNVENRSAGSCSMASPDKFICL